MSDYYDRDGKQIPNDWWDNKKHRRKYGGNRTNTRVARTIVGDVTVSTVWLGLDHSDTSLSGPIIFETMIFGDPWDLDIQRYETELDAVRGHLRAVDRISSGESPFRR